MKRLGLNLGKYHGEGLEIGTYLREFAEAAARRGWRAERYGEVEGFELVGYSRGPKNAKRTVYISSGVHGDEPAGPVALRRLVEEDEWPEDAAIFLHPCLNPTGFQKGTRENGRGIDLNRNYRQPTAPEVIAHIGWLDTLPSFDLTLPLHEDWESEGFYLYEVNYEGLPSPAERIIEAVREIGPIQPTSVIDDVWQCEKGIIRPTIKPEERSLWAEAVYLVANKTRLSLTLEAPSDFPLPFRVEMLVRAVRAALGENS